MATASYAGTGRPARSSRSRNGESSYAFLSLLPQPPSSVDDRRGANGIGGRPCGRYRTRCRLRANALARGIARQHRQRDRFTSLTARRRSREQRVPLDAAGAFSTAFSLCPRTPRRASTRSWRRPAAESAARRVDVDANAAGLSLDVSAACNGPCDPGRDVPLLVHASRAGSDGTRDRRRSPHVYAATCPKAALGDGACGSTRPCGPTRTATRRWRFRIPTTSSARPTACASNRAARPPIRASPCRQRRPRSA